MLNRVISLNVEVALSLPSSVVKTSFPLKAPSINDTIPVLVLVTLIGSVPFGKVSIPFPDTTTLKWVLFTAVWLSNLTCS
jgi:hypothetical protein